MQSEIEYLYETPLTWRSAGELVVFNPFPIPEYECVQYRQRIPSDSSASVHYEVMTEEGDIRGYRIVLHSEPETADENYYAQKELLRYMRMNLRNNGLAQSNFEIGRAKRWLNVYSKDLIPTGLSKEDFIRRVTDLMAELYELAESFLKKAERDPKFNPYGWDETDEVTEKMMTALDLVEPPMFESEVDTALWQGNSHASVISVARLLKMNLCIPDYQRPYKWKQRNVIELLRDIEDAIARTNTGPARYRLGTVILHEQAVGGKEIYNVVDGQQRLLTLSLLLFCLKAAPKELDVPLLNNADTLKNLSRQPESQKRLHDNYIAIKEYFGNRTDLKRSFFTALYELLQVVVLKVEREDEAFQLFDAQNRRGRPLDPHDLLKAHHLRAMQMNGASDKQMKRRVMGWESVPPSAIRSLFDSYLFRVYNWARGQKTHAFTAKDIVAFKGLSHNRNGHMFPFVRRAVAAGHEFQIGADFQAGECFFALVEHYLDLRDDVNELLNGENILDREFVKMSRKVMRVMHCPGVSGGFRYLHDLFRCVLFCYADRFGIENLDSRILAKLCRWSYAVMLNRDRMSERTVNRYAIGQSGYTNEIAMFAVIQEALQPTEIVGQPVKIPETNGPLFRRLTKLEVSV